MLYGTYLLLSTSTNARNDALLHHLVHTQLLSGSLRADLNLSHAQREKALAGRISELAGSSKLGKGELAVRTDEKNRATKRIRDGMKSKQKERDKTKLDEVCSFLAIIRKDL